MKVQHNQEKIVLRLHYNGSNSFLYNNAVKLYQFKAKDSEIKSHPLSFGHISTHFTIDNMKKTGLEGSVQVFCLFFCFYLFIFILIIIQSILAIF